LDKIRHSREHHIARAFQTNLQQKRQLIGELESKLVHLHKECEAKNLKLTHLRFERETMINQLQMEHLRKQERDEETEQIRRTIEVKRKEEERALDYAEKEVNRQIAEQ